MTEEIEEPPAQKEELEGEGQERLIGIMYSERKWVVPEWMKVVFLLCAFAMIGGLFLFSVNKRLEMLRLQVDAVVEPSFVIPQDAPNILLSNEITHKNFNLADHKGQWVFINFWATWCPPCRDEMPSLEMLNRRYKDKMVMVAVTVDEDWNEVTRFFGKTLPSFEVLWDKSKKTARTYGTRKFPETYLINPAGKVAAKYIGPRDWYNAGTVDYFDGVLAGKRDPT